MAASWVRPFLAKRTLASPSVYVTSAGTAERTVAAAKKKAMSGSVILISEGPLEPVYLLRHPLVSRDQEDPLPRGSPHLQKAGVL